MSADSTEGDARRPLLSEALHLLSAPAPLQRAPTRFFSNVYADIVSEDGDLAGAVGIAPRKAASVDAAPTDAPRRTLSALGVAIVCFAFIAGGPFGIEGAVGAAGPLPTFLMLVIAAFTWSLPQALVATELATMMPSNAGFIEWVLRGCGPILGFVNAWSTVFAMVTNIPLFTLIIADAIARLVPSLTVMQLYGIQIGALVLGVVINVIGTQAVERVSGVMILLAQSPFVIIPLLALSRRQRFDWVDLTETSPQWTSTLAVSLSTILWNTQGFNAIGNIAGEVIKPERDIPRGVALAAVAVTLNYVIPLLVTVPLSWLATSTGDDDGSTVWYGWDAGHFVSIANGSNPILGDWAAVCAVFSCMNNLISQIALGSRSLQAVVRARMAPDRLGFIGDNATIFKTPVPATLLLAAVSSGIMLLSFDYVVTIELLFLLIGLILQFVAFLLLKYRAPDAERPYTVPGGLVGAWAVAIPLFALCAVVLGSNLVNLDTLESAGIVVAILIVLIGMGVYWKRHVFTPKILDEMAANAVS